MSAVRIDAAPAIIVILAIRGVNASLRAVRDDYAGVDTSRSPRLVLSNI